MRTAVLKRSLCVLVLVAVAATGVKALANAAFDDFKKEGETKSWSVAEARERGVLVTELAAAPSEVSVPGGRVRFGEIWVEERALSAHKFVWLPGEQRVGGYRLHF